MHEPHVQPFVFVPSHWQKCKCITLRISPCFIVIIFSLTKAGISLNLFVVVASGQVQKSCVPLRCIFTVCYKCLFNVQHGNHSRHWVHYFPLIAMLVSLTNYKSSLRSGRSSLWNSLESGRRSPAQGRRGSDHSGFSNLHFGFNSSKPQHPAGVRATHWLTVSVCNTTEHGCNLLGQY